MEIVRDTSAAATAVRGVLAALQQAHHAKDAAAIAACYAPGARIADLAPPLMRRGIDAAGLQAWLDGWDAPVELIARDMEVEIDRGPRGLPRRRAHADRTGGRFGRLVVPRDVCACPHGGGLAHHPCP
jgi:ketosteroid isomerase-like protein